MELELRITGDAKELASILETLQSKQFDLSVRQGSSKEDELGRMEWTEDIRQEFWDALSEKAQEFLAFIGLRNPWSAQCKPEYMERECTNNPCWDPKHRQITDRTLQEIESHPGWNQQSRAARTKSIQLVLDSPRFQGLPNPIERISYSPRFVNPEENHLGQAARTTTLRLAPGWCEFICSCLEEFFP